MVAAASALQVPLMLGERGGGWVEEQAEEVLEEAPARPRSGWVGLTALAAEIEGGRLRVIDEGDLATALRSRIALRTLRRRAEKRGQAPVVRCRSREFQALAKSTGWQTEFVSVREPSARPVTLRSRGPLAKVLPFRPVGSTGGVAPSSDGEAGNVARGLGSAASPGVTRGVVGGRKGWLLGAVPLVLLTSTLLYPHASITLSPVTESTIVEIPLTVDPTLKKADPATGRLPGRAITKELSDTQSAPATGKRTVPDAKSTGEIVLLNRAESAVTVPKGSVVLAGAVKFATQSDVTVAPSRRAGSSNVFGMATVRIQAVTGGPSGNVDRNKIDRIEGPLATSLTVQNNQPTRGGTERAATFVTEDDRKKLQEQLYRSISERLTQQVKRELPTSDKESLIGWSGQNPAIVESVFSKNAEDEASTISLTLKLRFGATAFANEAYNQLVRDVAARGGIPTKPGYRVTGNSIQPEAPSLAGAENGTVRLMGRARATVSADVDPAKLRGELAGKPLAAVRGYLAELPGIASHDVRATNFLPDKMPFLGWRISISTPAEG